MWKLCTLGDLGEIVGGATPSTQNDSYYGGSIPWITPKDLSIQAGRYITKGERSITQQGYESCSASLLPKGTVLFSSRAPIGYIAIAKNELCTNQGFKSIIPNSETNGMFLYYLLKNNKKKIEASGSGTTFKEVSSLVMRRITVNVPSYAEQCAIAAILSCLDDKIELNKKINANLEAQAQAIFKSWFIDFEPFQDGEFVDSMFRLIPKKWRVGLLSEIGEIVGGATPSKDKADYYTESGSGISWITPKDLSVNKDKFVAHGDIDITELGYKNSSTKLMPDGSVLFSSRAPIGYMAISSGEVCTNQGFKSVVPRADVGNGYIYYMLKSQLEEIINLGSGSTFKEVSGSVMKSIPIIIPDAVSLREFQDFCDNIFYQQKVLEAQNRTLAALRDTLLPKLMSGDIEAPPAEIV